MCMSDYVPGWKCCKPRVLTFDEFMEIAPCTKGKHTTVEEAPKPSEAPAPADGPKPQPTISRVEAATAMPNARVPVTAAATASPKPAASPAPLDDESDDPDATPTTGVTCKRKNCGLTYAGGERSDEECTHHPGQPIFHEGSKGWTCCKRRVLEFDEFLRIPGCKTKKRHLFVGAKKDENTEEVLESVR